MEMNTEHQNRAFFQDTFCEVHASQSLAGKVKNMEKLKKNKAMFTAKWIVAVATMAVVLFAGSNGITYAMTGSTWVESMLYRLKLKDVTYEVPLQQEGTTYYSEVFNEADGDATKVRISTNEDGSLKFVDVMTEQSAHLSVSEKEIWLLDGDVEIDLTAALEENGEVSGSYERNGYTKEYRVRMQGEVPVFQVVTLYEGMDDARSTFDEETYRQESAMPTPHPEQ